MNHAPEEAPAGGRVFRWLHRRYDLTPVVEFVRHKEVPVGVHSMIWYYLGGTTLFFFAVQIVTGVLLLVYYQAGESTSYETIRFLTTKVPFGWLFRAVHAWSAHLMILSLLTHMFSTFFLKAYRRPRELTWVTGVLLLAVALGFGFSGYLLPWNELAYFATAVGTDVVKSVPLVGSWMLEVLRGGPDVTIATLYRFFSLHVVVLPLVAFAIIGLHLLLIQRQGMAPPVGHDTAPRGMRFFPDFALRDALIWLLALMALVTLAVLLPYGPGLPGAEWELGQKADPAAPAYPGIKPEWYFLWVYQLLKEFPSHVLGLEGPQGALLVSVVLLGIWALAPWLDRRGRENHPSPAFTDLGVAALVFVVFLMLKAWDVGGGAGPEVDVRRVAWVAAWIVLAGGGLVDLVRLLRGRRFLWFSGAALVQVVLHGLLGLSYLAAGALSLVLVLAGLVVTWRRPGPRAGVHPHGGTT